MTENKVIILPSHIENEVNTLKLGELKKKVKAFYTENLKGKTVKNKHKGITVLFNAPGLKHLLFARNVGYVKLKAVFILRDLVKNAIFCNFKNPDINDNPGITGYLNFKSKAKIEGNIYAFRIVVRLTNQGKFYYDHSVKVKK